MSRTLRPEPHTPLAVLVMLPILAAVAAVFAATLIRALEPEAPPMRHDTAAMLKPTP